MRTITDANPNVRDFEFRSGPVTIGSHSGNLVQLPDVEIASHHATLDIVGDDWVYVPMTRDDRQSRLNEQPVSGRVTVTDGDVITVARFELRFSIEPEGEVVLPEPGKVDELALIRQFPLPPRSIVRKPDADVKLNAQRRATLAAVLLAARSCSDLPSLMEAILRTLEPNLGARMVWMGLRTKPDAEIEYMDGRLEGTPTSLQPPKLETYVYRCLNRQQCITVPRTGDGVTQSVLAVPIPGEHGPIGLLYADTLRHARVYDDADLDLLTTLASVIAPLLHTPLHGDIRSSVAPTGAAAAGPLACLEPRKVPTWSKLELAYHSSRGAEQNGDLMDVAKMPNGLAAILVARVVAGSARTLVALAEIRGAFRVSVLHADPPRVLLKALNWLLSDEADPCSVDVVAAVVNPKSGAAEIATAGRIGAILVGQGGKAKKLTKLDSPAVGNGQPIEYTGLTIRVNDSETLAFYTPGCVKATNESGESLGESRLVETLCEGFGRSASAALDELLVDLAGYLKNPSSRSDSTILLAHRPA